MDLHVLVLGAGSTGLLIAQGLKKYGIRFSIYERESEIAYNNHQRDWSMAMLWGTEHLNNTLPGELLSRVDEIKADPFSSPTTTLPFSNGKTGEHLVDIPGGLAIRVNREKLRKFLSTGIDIKFGKTSTRIEELEDKVLITFEDGSTTTGDTVICCDGIKGLGRTTLLGPQATLSTAPCTIVNIVNKYKPEQARFIYEALNPIKFASHPDQPTLFLLAAVDIPSLERPEDWKLQCLLTTWNAEHADTNEERLRTFKQAASKYAEPWRSAALWLPDDTHIPPDGVRYWANPTAWPTWNGKMTLGGDAAHPMMPFRAQGLNNALADADQYVINIVTVRDGRVCLGDAVAAYGEEVLKRGAKEIQLSAAWGPMLHDWTALVQSPLMKRGYGKQQTDSAVGSITSSLHL
ncbi:hypothetical protein Vi05172_g6130 [Venturia inaequalis]|nr:hypothetical protein Vi05172_g6130 [Venturia inaequalis]